VPGSIPVGDCGDQNGMGVPAAGELVDLFLPTNIARQFVGISVGISRNRSQKLSNSDGYGIKGLLAGGTISQQLI
jgi:hypothetical protein